MSDLQLRQDILDELEFEPRIDAANIGVAVEEGVVTLTGHVSSYAQKVAAEAAARRVKGVRAIAQEIEVRFPFEKKSSDDEIAKRAANILHWDSMVPDECIQVSIQRGWIILTGMVDWQYQRMAAEDDVRKLSGVVGVNNQIKVNPQIEVPDIQRRIEAALKRNAEIEAKGIRIRVHDGTVTLAGIVHDWIEHDAIKNAAWSGPGVRMVEDHLTIG
jgi:osmotically-inducible protein OsmY